MKKTCLLLLLAAGWTAAAMAQQLGLRVSGGVARDAVAGKAAQPRLKDVSSAAVIYYEQRLSGRLSLSGGLGMGYVPEVSASNFDNPWYAHTMSVVRLEAPVFLSFRLCPPGKSGWQFRLLGGYAFARELEGTLVNGYPEGPRQIEKRRYDMRSFHYFSLGAEAKCQFRNRQFVSIGLAQRWEAFNPGYPGYFSPKLHNAAGCLMIATGYDFRRPKRPVQ